MWGLVIVWFTGAGALGLWELLAFASGLHCWDCFKQNVLINVPALRDQSSALLVVTYMITILVAWPFILYGRVTAKDESDHDHRKRGRR